MLAFTLSVYCVLHVPNLLAFIPFAHSWHIAMHHAYNPRLRLLRSDVAWQIGQKVDKQLSQLGAHRLAPFGSGDEDSGKMPEQFQAWGQAILEAQSLDADADAVKEPIEPVLGPEVN